MTQKEQQDLESELLNKSQRGKLHAFDEQQRHSDAKFYANHILVDPQDIDRGILPEDLGVFLFRPQEVATGVTWIVRDGTPCIPEEQEDLKHTPLIMG